MKHQLALITGASSGLGKSLAIQLAKKNISLILSARNHSQLSQLANDLSSYVDITCICCDLAKDRKELIEEIETKSPDLIINNAGFGLYGEALDHSMQDQMDMVKVNMEAVVEITLKAAKTLKKKKKKGTILNVSSLAGSFLFPYFSLYSSTKSFVTHFSRSLDAECKKEGVRILVSCPGRIDTSFSLKASKGTYTQKSKTLMSKEFAVQRILSQIEKQKGIDVFDFRYKLTQLLSPLIPQKIQLHIVKKVMKNLLKPPRSNG